MITEKMKANDNEKITCGVFLDLQKVFDTVNYKFLFSKLEHYGKRVIPLNQRKTYQNKRLQFVEMNYEPSETFFRDYGVPPGSFIIRSITPPDIYE